MKSIGIPAVVAGVAYLLVIAGEMVPESLVDARFTRGAELAVLITASLAILILYRRRRESQPLVVLVLVALVLLGAFVTLDLSGDWVLYKAHSAEKEESPSAYDSLGSALIRMDAPGIEVPHTRMKLTRYGLVSQYRVTTMTSLALIALERGDTPAAIHWLERAVAAGSDPREQADVSQLEATIDRLRER